VLARALIRRGLALVGLVAVLALGCAVSSAMAAAPACPTAPDAYTGSDATVGELRAERIDLAGSCAALAARLDVLHDDAAPAHDDATAIAAAVTSAAGDVRALGQDPDAPLNTTTRAGTAAQTVELSDATQGWLQADLGTLRGALYVLVGAVLGATVVPILVRWLRP
jgi:hypothetical protein